MRKLIWWFVEEYESNVLRNQNKEEEKNLYSKVVKESEYLIVCPLLILRKRI